MALTRKFLTALGIESDKVDEIISAHSETVDALKTERDKYKEDALKFPAVQKELDEIKKATEEQDGKNPYEVKYTELKKEYDEYKANVDARELSARKADAYRALLREAGVSDKRIDTVLKVTDLSGQELGSDGMFINKSALADSIKSEWADFIVTTGTSGASSATPPKRVEQDYDNMSDAEYYKATYESAKKK